MRDVSIGPVTIGPGHPLALIAGPCMLESPERAIRIATGIDAIANRLGIPWVFKASFDKANRTSGHSARGPGLAAALPVFAHIRNQLGVPVTTDIHTPDQADATAESVDLLQIPAFLCRQTDLLHAAAATGRPVNVKKGQFLAPEDTAHIVGKLDAASGVLLTERGTSFGYHRLVVDMAGLPIMRQFAPVVFDATHSTQRPSGLGGVSGGAREHVPALARAAVAVGVDALFLEVHDDPDNALSDAATQWPLDQLEALLTQVLEIPRGG